MGYNVLSGSTSVINVITSGSFTGDGSGLENVKQFELQNAAATKIPFYKLIAGELGLNANDGFTFSSVNNSLTVPGLTSSVGIRLTNVISGSIAGNGSFLGVDSNGNLVVTSSGISYDRRFVTSTTTASSNDVLLGVSASSALEIRLSSASTFKNGQYFVVKDEAGNADVFNITVRTSGSQTIDGGPFIVLESPFAAVSIYSNGSDKFFIY
tara:strand:- start:562 stop:1194 length:633 start_codon:yes stop_codon:yes gene_type:complete